MTEKNCPKVSRLKPHKTRTTGVDDGIDLELKIRIWKQSKDEGKRENVKESIQYKQKKPNKRQNEENDAGAIWKHQKIKNTKSRAKKYGLILGEDGHNRWK